MSGSPHLKHEALKRRVQNSISKEIAKIKNREGRCRVLEVGAGHGVFSGTIVDAGAELTITEMSEASYDFLHAHFHEIPGVTVLHDPSGDWLGECDAKFDLIICISVLHHIPDYQNFLRLAFSKTEPGGSFISWQDPLYYPRRGSLDLAIDKGAYFLWRLTQGNFRRGISTRIRRLRGVIDESNPADMVEYHVVRQGVDEEAIMATGAEFFDSQEIECYFSTQSTLIQKFGIRLPANTFGVTFRARRGK